MPPLTLASLFQQALPWLSVDGRAVISTLVCYNGRVGSAKALSTRLGLRSRFQLSRLLRREGLPPYEELAGWVCVLYWMVRADADGRGALLALARQMQMDTATCYRLVRRITGHCWTDLRRIGTAEVLHQFQQRVHPARTSQPSGLRLLSAELGTIATSASLWNNGRAQRVGIDGGPYGIAVRGRDLAYVTRARAACIERLDLATGRFTGTIPVGCTPTCVTFDESGALAYVSVQFCDEIAVIDAVAHRKIRVLPVSGDPFPLLALESRHTLFVTTNADRLWAFNSPTGRLLGSIPLPATSHHLALHPGGDRLYVATRAGGTVLEVDVNRLRVLRTFVLGGWPQGLALSPDGATLYVANEHQPLDALSLGTGRRIARIEAEQGAVGLVMSPDHRFLYTTHPRDGKVGLIAVPSLTPTGAIHTGGRPGQIAFDAAGHALITNEAGWLDSLPLGQLEIVAA
jgi:DNA-binding beta-propeller fold protein YncE